ncbi:MAG: NUDIX domain-containing protein [Candidatus Paceibacterota bacterium]|jgi:NAD+ diphosphatase
MRNITLAVFINKLHRAYWFFIRPKTKGVKVILFNQNRILMVRLTYYPNTWTFPGGGVHENENINDAIIRECKEEVGIQLQKPEYVGDLHFEHEYKKDTLSIFKEDIDNSEIHIDGKEIAEANWYELDRLPVMGKNAKAIFDFVMGK